MKMDLAAEGLAALLTRALLDEAADHDATCTALKSVLAHIGTDALSTGIASVGDLFDKASNAARNRYADYHLHPRLGHEPLIFEARAAQVSYNKAAAALAGGCDLFAWPRFLAAEARLRAIVLALNDLSIALPPLPRAKRSKTRPSCERFRPHHFSAVVQTAILEVAYGDREQGIVDLKRLIRTEDDHDGNVAKLLIATQDEELVLEFNKLAREIRRCDSTGTEKPASPTTEPRVLEAPKATQPRTSSSGERAANQLSGDDATTVLQDIESKFDTRTRPARSGGRFTAAVRAAAQNSGEAR